MIKTQTVIMVTPVGVITSTDLAEDSGLVLQTAVSTTLRDRMATRQRTVIYRTEENNPTLLYCLHGFNRLFIFIRATIRKKSYIENLGMKIKPNK